MEKEVKMAAVKPLKRRDMADFTEERFAAKSVEYETPLSLFEPLNAEFGFELDVCATHDNKKVDNCYTMAENGLKQHWVGTCWCNPPYGREMPKWIQKAIDTSERGFTVVMLIPARTNTGWWHDLVLPNAEVRFVRGRPKFNGGKHGLPFPLAICVFKV
jgi:phage N-6-adenine-methyltransferase